VLDVHLPDHQGFDVADQLCALPDAPDVVLTSSRADYSAVAGSTGSVGFVPKNELSAEALEVLLG
jgi:CheY-like chemotaxis protein